MSIDSIGMYRWRSYVIVGDGPAGVSGRKPGMQSLPSVLETCLQLPDMPTRSYL